MASDLQDSGDQTRHEQQETVRSGDAPDEGPHTGARPPPALEGVEREGHEQDRGAFGVEHRQDEGIGRHQHEAGRDQRHALTEPPGQIAAEDEEAQRTRAHGHQRSEDVHPDPGDHVQNMRGDRQYRQERQHHPLVGEDASDGHLAIQIVGDELVPVSVPIGEDLGDTQFGAGRADEPRHQQRGQTNGQEQSQNAGGGGRDRQTALDGVVRPHTALSGSVAVGPTAPMASKYARCASVIATMSTSSSISMPARSDSPSR
ncbi:unannotated protein [freshwater metagenome]|uniref:Unannotated protein n=1 Tax=freshwater metagenome TaxID=449393 RepID=A0A6J6FKZ5_9ZZZZ